MAYTYNYRMANKGRSFEEVINYQNNTYHHKGISTIQKIPTPWVVVRRYGKIVDAYPDEKSTLDFRGAAKLNDGNTYPVSFDAKETEMDYLPLKNISAHQIDFIRNAVRIGEFAFIVCHLLPLRKFFYVDGALLVKKYDEWKANKGRHGFNKILPDEMIEIPQTPGNVCDYFFILNRRIHANECDK